MMTSIHMGLTCYASCYKKRVHLRKDIVKEFEDADINLCEHYGGSFRGKSYNVLIELISGCSLYGYVCCKSTYETLTSFIEKNEEKLLQDESEKNELDIRDYFDDDRYKDPESYKFFLEDLHGLQRFFKICHKHNLQIYSCY